MKPLSKLPVFIILIIFSLSVFQTSAKVKLPRLISNGMVLQRDVPLKIWGWADAGEKVKIEFLGKTFLAKADKKGNWKAELPATAAGGPFVMKINEVELKDILVGDVWICSGQSNMELPLRRLMDLYEAEILKTNNIQIRQFRSSSRNDMDKPQTDFKDGNWLPAIQANILDFSGVAYFFATELYQKYKIPIGLINTAIGGSPAESWLSEIPAKKYLDPWLFMQAKGDSIRKKNVAEGKKPFNFFAELNQNDPGVGRWSKNDLDVTDWPVMSVPGYWGDKGVDLRNGSMWFYKEFDIPDSLVGKKAVLRLGRIIDSDSAFVNGTFVGTISYQYPPRIYPLQAGVLKAGKNKLMVRVIAQGNKGGFVEEKPYELRVGSQVIDLTGDWNYHLGAVLNPTFSPFNMSFRPSGLFNTLTAPILNYPLRGVIWFQGESNTGRSKDYYQLFPDVIRDWRAQFAQSEMPFLFVQLANLGVPSKQPVESGWAELRDAQRRTLELSNTGMAVAFDLGEWNDIHPLNKKEVSRRLSLEASRVAYHETKLVSAGPLYESMEISGKSIILTFKSIGSGLYANSLLYGFQIAGADGRYVWANAVVLTKTRVKVWSDKVPNPQNVRYAWDDNPAGANLKNKEGLPASPFTTAK
jgi:sialate O-acetylesterase